MNMISRTANRCSLNPHLLKKTVLRLYSTSVETVRKPAEEYYEKELKQFETLTNITKRVREKKPQRKPFVKNLLIGKFDTEILVFPQLELDEVQRVEAETKALENLLQQRHMVNVDSLSDKNFRQNLADLRAIGIQASQLLDGRESTPMEVMKYLEVFSGHKLRESLLHHEMLGVQTLVKYADDKLKKKYLHSVMKGEKVVAFCMTEPELNDIDSIQTKAELSSDQKYWTLNGTKYFVINGISADYFIVFATTDVITRDTLKEVKISTFLVEKDSPGISWKKIEPTDVEMAEIVFDNVQVLAENLIGRVNEGEKILTSIVSDFRLSCGPPCITLTRNMLNKFHQNAVHKWNSDLELHKTEAIMSKEGEIALNLYASECVTYLTAGLQDWYENQDVSIESAIVKVLASEAAYNSSTICLDLIGLPATLKDHWACKAHADALNYMTLHETNESLRMFIALMGLQFAGLELTDKVKKLRNPLYHGTYTLMRLLTGKRNERDDPKLDLELFSYLHPALMQPSKQLEYCVKRLEFATETILTRYGLECVNRHIELRKLADIMIDCYAMTAILARASRAYCLGLQFSNYDMMLANSFCNLAKERVQHNVLSLYDSEHKLPERNFIVFAKQLTKSKKYFIESAMHRFY